MKLNALDGSILVQKILYYGGNRDPWCTEVYYLGYAPNAQVLVAYMTQHNNHERIMFLNPNDLTRVAANLMHNNHYNIQKTRSLILVSDNGAG